MIGFVIGYLVFRLLLFIRSENQKVTVYAPLIPFGIGGFFSLPYLVELGGMGELQDYIGQAVNLFGAYGWLHHNDFAITYLTSLNIVAVVCGVLYLLIVRHYIALIKSLRRINAS